MAIRPPILILGALTFTGSDNNGIGWNEFFRLWVYLFAYIIDHTFDLLLATKVPASYNASKAEIKPVTKLVKSPI